MLIKDTMLASLQQELGCVQLTKEGTNRRKNEKDKKKKKKALVPIYTNKDKTALTFWTPFTLKRRARGCDHTAQKKTGTSDNHIGRLTF